MLRISKEAARMKIARSGLGCKIGGQGHCRPLGPSEGPASPSPEAMVISVEGRPSSYRKRLRSAVARANGPGSTDRPQATASGTERTDGAEQDPAPEAQAEGAAAETSSGWTTGLERPERAIKRMCAPRDGLSLPDDPPCGSFPSPLRRPRGARLRGVASRRNFATLELTL